MPPFRVDLHIHSRFSRATSKRLNAPHLAAWGMMKGLSVLGTGDFTHPAWREELRDFLDTDDNTGLFRLKTPVSLEREIPEYAGLPGHCANTQPLFILQAEISSIYKKDGAVRKVHNLVFMPDFESADLLCRKLSGIGNLHADGRPILGLDSRDLLEIVLETDNRGVVIPAHIWTPWFSLFGSRSGFDSLEACFGDLSRHIFALETGLSSDPDMIRMWSALDRYALVSNSDCHSGENLGREANLFEGEPSYDGIFEALRRAAHSEPPRGDCRFLGTYEFFPEEGKYHLDGHRACEIMLEPGETRQLNGLCPVCGKPVTVGVLHRVHELADRETPVFQPGEPGFSSLIPLPELLGEVLGVGAKSGKVRTRHSDLLAKFGDELGILMDVPESDLCTYWDILGEAVGRMRRGEVIRQGGYDGEYGVVRVFNEEELRELHGGKVRSLAARRKKQADEHDQDTPPKSRRKKKGLLSVPMLPGFAMPEPVAPAAHSTAAQDAPSPASSGPSPAPTMPVRPKAAPKPSGHDEATHDRKRPEPHLFAPDVVAYTIAQQRAIKAGPHPVMVIAGPGSGKTRTLVGRIARLLDENVPASEIVAVTFTRRAASELRERLKAVLQREMELPLADTLHALALREWAGEKPVLLGEEAAKAAFAAANPELSGPKRREMWDCLNLARERMTRIGDEALQCMERYQAWKREREQADYTDLLEHWLAGLTRNTSIRPWTQVLVDEIQDLSPLQLQLVKALLPEHGEGFFGIGDPDQAIYGFRGAHANAHAALTAAWNGIDLYTLSDSHRSGPGIIEAAGAVIGHASAGGQLHAARPIPSELHLFVAPDARKEANWVADRVAGLIGWGGHTELDRAGDESLSSGPCSPGEIAVLVRTRTLMPTLREALERKGIPVASPEAAPFWTDPGIAIILSLAALRFNAPLQQSKALHLTRPLPDPLPAVPESYWQGKPDQLELLVGHFPILSTLASTPPLKELCAAWQQYAGWPGLLDVVLTGQAMDLLRTRAERVQIMTLHASKGLEFRAVFLPAMEDGLLPFSGVDALLGKAGAEPLSHAALAEERRLLYVGITRASEAVYASRSESRTLYGHTLTLKPSRFLQALPESFRKSRLVKQTRVAVKQMSLLD